MFLEHMKQFPKSKNVLKLNHDIKVLSIKQCFLMLNFGLYVIKITSESLIDNYETSYVKSIHRNNEPHKRPQGHYDSSDLHYMV